MEKHSKEFKLEVVKYYLEHDQGYVRVAKHFGNISDTMVLYWVRKYKELGEQGLEKNKKQSYSGEFKENVVKYMHANNLSYMETTLHFNLGNSNTPKDWEQIYYEKGPQGLYEKRKYKKSGKPRKMKDLDKNQKIEEKDLKNMTKEELLEKYEYLRMENAYLKKLQALVQERTKPQSKKK